jgi:hypothetical protein
VVTTWLALAASAADSSVTPVLAPDPVLEWAERDLRASRLARTGLLLTLSGPGLFLVGDLALRTAIFAEARGVAAGLALVTVGSVASLAGPPLLLHGVSRSRKALDRQGLEVSGTLPLLGTLLWAGSIVPTVAGAFSEEADASQALQVVGLTGYVSAVALGAAQMRTNHVARRDAGWLGLAPSPQGLVVAGQF